MKEAILKSSNEEILMNCQIDTRKQRIILEDKSTIPLYSSEGFKILSQIWLKVGWDQKHPYSFTWLGRPIIQIPEDPFRLQEVIYTIKPDVIIETGIAHGGSLIFSASLCKLMGRGRVIGVDIEIRPHNRKAIENHELYEFITMIEGDSISNKTFQQVKELVKENEIVLIILDSYHAYDHVLSELNLYSRLVSIGSYIIATDGSQRFLHDTPRAKTDYPEYVETWSNNNPAKAIEDFIAKNPNFKVEEPKFLFNEGNVNFRVSHWVNAFIKKVK